MSGNNNEQDLAISFGPFRLSPKARLLEKDGAPLHIGGRALDILIFLAERPGEVVDKRDLIKQVWSDVNVDEGSLRFHVTALRKALGGGAVGARYVVNVPGRGYCFAAPLARAEPAPAPSTGSVSSGSVPARATRQNGRTDRIHREDCNRTFAASFRDHCRPRRHRQDLCRRLGRAPAIRCSGRAGFLCRFRRTEGCQACARLHCVGARTYRSARRILCPAC